MPDFPFRVKTQDGGGMGKINHLENTPLGAL